MKPSDEMLMAYVDGELDAAAVAEVEAALAADPALLAQVQQQRALRARLQSAFAPVLDEPVPTRLREAVDAPARPPVIDLSAVRADRAARRWGPPQWAAMAASLFLGVVLARWLPDGMEASLQSTADGGLMARGDLAAALEQQLASEPASSTAVAVGVSFKGADGRYCRALAWHGERVLTGLACRGVGGWQVPILQEAEVLPGGELRMAATALPAAVLAEIDARIDGEPLDADGERQARERGWR